MSLFAPQKLSLSESKNWAIKTERLMPGEYTVSECPELQNQIDPKNLLIIGIFNTAYKGGLGQVERLLEMTLYSPPLTRGALMIIFREIYAPPISGILFVGIIMIKWMKYYIPGRAYSIIQAEGCKLYSASL